MLLASSITPPFLSMSRLLAVVLRRLRFHSGNGADWQSSKVAAAGTHHIETRSGRGEALYEPRFESVLPFHSPGLAPVRLAISGGWRFIDVAGRPVSRIYSRAFGFYDSRAAVVIDGDWHHVNTNCERAYPASWAWCGNMQSGRSVVRLRDTLWPRYCHINRCGQPLPRTGHYAYAGDFREGFAVVRDAETGLCDFVDEGGARKGWAFLELHVFHKGFARAMDSEGWFFVNRNGTDTLKGRRFADLEPFYNGVSLAKRMDGSRVLLSDNDIYREVALIDPAGQNEVE